MPMPPPSTNLEIKAHCRDPRATRAAARRVATRRVGIDRQVDTYFRTRSGRLKLRESSLSGAQLIPYLRADEPGVVRSDYRILPVEDPVGLKRLLEALLGVHVVVRKQREIFLYENVRIHLDRVEGLGEFLEFEAVYDGSTVAEAAERKKLDFLMKELGVGEGDLIAASYEGLVRVGEATPPRLRPSSAR